MIDFKDPQIRYLIDFANIKQGLIKYQNTFLNRQQLFEFIKNEHYGFPLLLPLGIKYFNYKSSKSIFKVSKTLIMNKIFKIKKKNYVGLKIFFNYGEKFTHDVELKNQYKKQFNYIINFNLKLIKQLNFLKNKKNYLTAFQTRNIPHFGHEIIMQRLLNKKGKVVINPLIGTKKKGDYKNEILNKVFKKLISEKEYNNNLYYGPVIANMQYGGPREAVHHINIREKLGFNRFAIGRDHAGAENVYKPLEAYNFTKKKIKKYKIDIFFHKGSYFCERCNKVVLKNDCKHNYFKEISGSEFRKKILKKQKFLFARNSIQEYIHRFKEKLFY